MLEIITVSSKVKSTVFTVGRSIAWNNNRSITFLLISFLIIIQRGPILWGQLALPLFSLMLLSHICTYSLTAFSFDSIRENANNAKVIWSNAIRMRLGLAIAIIAILSFFKIPFHLLGMILGFLLLQVYNESYKIPAKIEQRSKSWILLSGITGMIPILWLISVDNNFLFEELLKIILLAEIFRFVLLNISFNSKYKVPYLPQLDFTQLRLSGKYFFRSSIVLINHKSALFMAALFLPSYAMTSFHLFLFWTITGIAFANQIGMSGVLKMEECNAESVKSSLLKMLMIGSAMSLIWTLIGIQLLIAFNFTQINLWLFIPGFLMILFSYLQIPLLYALLKLNENKFIFKNYIIITSLQILVSFFTLMQGEINLCLILFALISFVQTALFRVQLQKII